MKRVIKRKIGELKRLTTARLDKSEESRILNLVDVDYFRNSVFFDDTRSCLHSKEREELRAYCDNSDGIICTANCTKIGAVNHFGI